MKFAVFIMGALQTGLLTLVPILMDRTGISAVNWSWLMALGLFVYVLSSPSWGRVIDRIGAKKALFYSFLWLLLSQVLLMVSVQWLAVQLSFAALCVALVAARVGYGLTASGVFPAAQTWITQQHSENAAMASALARLNVVSQLGRLLGPILVSVWVLFDAPLLSIWSLLFLGLAFAFYLWFSDSSAGQLIDKSTDEFAAELAVDEAMPNTGHDVKHTQGDFSWQQALPVYLMAFSLTGFLGALQFLLGPYLQTLWSITAEQASAQLGAMLTTAALVSVLVALKIGPRLFAQGVTTLAVVLVLISLGSLLLVVSDQVVALHIAVACLSSAVALATPWYGMVLRQTWSQSQGRIAGQLASVHMAGYGVGTLLGGWALQALGINVMQLFVLFPLVMLLCMAWVLFRFVRRISLH